MEKDFLKIAGNVHLAYYVEAADKLGIDYEIVIRSLMARFEYQGKHWFIINTALPINNVTSVTIAKRKNLTYRVLADAGIPVAVQLAAENYDQVKDFYMEHPNIVVKPVQNLGGKGVSILPRNEKELKEAFDSALENNKSKTKAKVLAETFQKGKNYRLLVCNNKVVGAVYRKAACVVGNGKDHIPALIEKANESRRERLLMSIKYDEEVEKCLDSQGLSKDYIPDNGEEVILRFNSNLSTGGTTEECYEQIDPYYLDLAINAVKAVGLKMGGLDLITEDISQEAPCIINEINYNPGLRVHYKVDKGKVVNVALPIMEYIRDYYAE